MNFKLINLTFSVVFFLLLSGLRPAAAQDYQLTSPDKRFTVHISAADSVRYDVKFNRFAIVLPSAIAMNLQQGTLGAGDKILKTKTIKSGRFNELSLSFNKNYQIVFRAYNHGIAYRFITNLGGSVKVLNEKANFKLAGAPAAILQETNTYTSWEGPYVRYNTVSEIGKGKRATTPALFAYPKDGVKVIIAESDVVDYPGMYVQRTEEGYHGDWAKYPTKAVLGSWGDFVSVVKERGDFLALTSGKRSFPWRIIIATDDDKDLLNNQLITELARPSVVKDVSWIKPGKATWEWWHDALLPGAPIPSGMDNRNTALYNYYVDFAAANQLEYLMIDAGWSNNHDVTKVNPKLDVQAVIKRAADKKVGVFLWCVATTLMKDLDKSLGFIQSTGAVGIKVDFFDRDDQLAMQWMEQIAKVAASKKLMVDFHGCTKPSGLEKTYPNVVNYEAVRGAESDKWDYTINPDHHLLIPFIRMLAGPMDYTPGAMRNRTKSEFKPIDPGLPSGQGTRVHDLAMYVIYNQPFGMLADSPTEYMKYPDVMKYLSAVPAVFDETLPLSASLGEYAMMAKRKNRDWYVGAMTNWNARELPVDFKFLKPGVNYTAEIYTDGKEADVKAEQYLHETVNVNSKIKLNLKLAPGGGAAIHLKETKL